jgi:hypothetical protein
MATPSLGPQLENMLKQGRLPGFASSEMKLWDSLLLWLESCSKKNVVPDHGFGGDWAGLEFELDDGFISLLGAIYQKTATYYNGIGKKSSQAKAVEAYMRRIRVLAGAAGLAKSRVTLTRGAHIAFTGGMQAPTLTFIPDPKLGVEFGSAPDQTAVGVAAPEWNVLKCRYYEMPGGGYGAKNHYVLAHMLNHHLNGSGANALNLIPFWGGANTEMSAKIEEVVKQYVNMGVEVDYRITLGPHYGAGYVEGTLDDILEANHVDNPADLNKKAKLQYDIVEMEQFLPRYIRGLAKAKNPSDGKWVVIVNNVKVDNFVPQTIPELYNA